MHVLRNNEPVKSAAVPEASQEVRGEITRESDTRTESAGPKHLPTHLSTDLSQLLVINLGYFNIFLIFLT